MRALYMSLLLAMMPLAAQAGELPGWMAGAWIERSGDSWSEEYWTSPRGGILLGAARMGKGEALEIWEQTRIAIDPDGSIAFYASPRGARAARFALESQSATAISFVNDTHDYPQRVRYWRDGNLLRAEISRLDGSDKQGWSYSPMGQ